MADTHGMLRSEIFDLFAGVDQILHAGDIGSPDLLDSLEAIAPVTAVWGNTDGFDLRTRLPEVAAVELEGLPVVVTHGHQLGIPTPEGLVAAYPEALVIVYGHTHRPLLQLVEGAVTVMNPGGAGARRFDFPASVGVLEFEAGLPPRGRLVAIEDDG